MNPVLKRIIQTLLVNDIVWVLVKPFVYLSVRLIASRENYVNRYIDKKNSVLCDTLFKDKVILNGIFKGLFYGEINEEGSSIYSKLLGSFESEISADLRSLLEKDYAYAVNVGCAEGYYAVGMAYYKPGLMVKAFDISERARTLCKQLAIYNKVEKQIMIGGSFSVEKLNDMNKYTRALFIADCEGCEAAIINKDLTDAFPNFDYIIELHYHVVPAILEKLSALLNKTHTIKLVTAVPEHEKVIGYDYPQLNGLTYEQKMFILNERSAYAQWFIAVAK